MKLLADLHVHTINSGHAYSTIEEYVAAAKKKGLRIIAITDHGPSMPGSPHMYYFNNMRMIPKKIDGVRIIRGVEANIINEKGELDMPRSDIEYGGIEFVLATFHPYCGYDNGGEEKNTQVLLRAMQNPLVNAIAHPENPKYPINVRQTVAQAKELGIALEINSSSNISRPGTYDKSLEFAKEARVCGCKVVLGSDSHISTMLGDFSYALKIVRESGLKASEVVNTSEKMVEGLLGSRGS